MKDDKIREFIRQQQEDEEGMANRCLPISRKPYIHGRRDILQDLEALLPPIGPAIDIRGNFAVADRDVIWQSSECEMFCAVCNLTRSSKIAIIEVPQRYLRAMVNGIYSEKVLDCKHALVNHGKRRPSGRGREYNQDPCDPLGNRQS